MGIKNRVSLYKSMFLLIEKVANYKFNLKRDHLIAQPTNRNFSNRSFANPNTRSHFESVIALIDRIESGVLMGDRISLMDVIKGLSRLLLNGLRVVYHRDA